MFSGIGLIILRCGGGPSPPSSARILHLVRSFGIEGGVSRAYRERSEGLAHSRRRPQPGTEEARTQGTFGAATPGRRVLYSASWVLMRLRRGGGAPESYRARRTMVNPARRERVTERG